MLLICAVVFFMTGGVDFVLLLMLGYVAALDAWLWLTG